MLKSEVQSMASLWLQNTPTMISWIDIVVDNGTLTVVDTDIISVVVICPCVVTFDTDVISGSVCACELIVDIIGGDVAVEDDVVGWLVPVYEVIWGTGVGFEVVFDVVTEQGPRLAMPRTSFCEWCPKFAWSNTYSHRAWANSQLGE